MIKISKNFVSLRKEKKYVVVQLGSAWSALNPSVPACGNIWAEELNSYQIVPWKIINSPAPRTTPAKCVLHAVADRRVISYWLSSALLVCLWFQRLLGLGTAVTEAIFRRIGWSGKTSFCVSARRSAVPTTAQRLIYCLSEGGSGGRRYSESGVLKKLRCL